MILAFMTVRNNLTTILIPDRQECRLEWKAMVGIKVISSIVKFFLSHPLNAINVQYAAKLHSSHQGLYFYWEVDFDLWKIFTKSLYRTMVWFSPRWSFPRKTIYNDLTKIDSEFHCFKPLWYLIFINATRSKPIRAQKNFSYIPILVLTFAD